MDAAYDDYGLVSSLPYPVCSGTGCATTSQNTRTVTFTNMDGLLTAIPSWATGITYHKNRMVASVTHANGMVVTIANDPDRIARPASIAATLPGPTTIWQTGTYAYDGAGNIQAMGSDTYSYDKVSRLTSGTLPSIQGGAPNPPAQGYTFDKYGSITQIATDDGFTSMALLLPTSGSTNRLTGGTYDSRGNLTALYGQTQDYDHFNLMRYRCTAINGGVCGGEEQAYVYTADDERVLQLGSQEIWTLRDFGNRVLRRNAGTVTSDYVYRGSNLLAKATYNGGTRHYAVDHLGSSRATTTGAGGNLGKQTFYPFGEIAASTLTEGDSLKFTGHERDSMSTSSSADDLDYMHARFFSPTTSRFLSVDPVGGNPKVPQSWNRYSYTEGNPLGFVDPNGQIRVRATYVGRIDGVPQFAIRVKFDTRTQKMKDKVEKYGPGPLRGPNNAVGVVGKLVGKIIGKASTTEDKKGTEATSNISALSSGRTAASFESLIQTRFEEMGGKTYDDRLTSGNAEVLQQAVTGTIAGQTTRTTRHAIPIPRRRAERGDPA